MASDREREIVAYAMANPHLRQREVADHFGMTQGAVTSAFRRCGVSWKYKGQPVGPADEATVRAIRRIASFGSSVSHAEIASALGCSASLVSHALRSSGMSRSRSKKPVDRVDTMESSMDSDTDAD